MESAKPARPVGGALAVPAALYTELVAALGDAQETAAMLQGGVAISGEEVAILLRDIRWVAEANYQARDAFGMEIGSAGFVPGFTKAARDGTVPVFFHTHPGAGPRPSTRDEKVESEMRRLALIRTGRPYFAALILGGTRDSPEFTARIYVHPDRSPINVRKLRVVGDHIQLLAAADAGVEVDAEIYDRQVRAFGQAGQAVLNSMTVGVVGAGGTGSSTFEQLVRLGIGTIVLIDDDLIKKANVTRGHETGIGDAGKHKVEVLEKAGARIGLGTSVVPVIGRVTAREVAQRLRHCDVVFGC